MWSTLIIYLRRGDENYVLSIVSIINDSIINIINIIIMFTMSTMLGWYSWGKKNNTKSLYFIQVWGAERAPPTDWFEERALLWSGRGHPCARLRLGALDPRLQRLRETVQVVLGNQTMTQQILAELWDAVKLVVVLLKMVDLLQLLVYLYSEKTLLVLVIIILLLLCT